MKLIPVFAAIAVFALQLLNLTDGQVDETLEPGTSGEAVVKATVKRIRDLQETQVQLDDDKDLLYRIALVETRYGTDNDTYRADYHGGIWQVDEDMFNETKVILDPSSRLARNIANLIEIQWHATTWEDLRKPLHSGLAARLFLAGIDEEIPLASDIEDQARYWKTYYI